MANSKFYKEIKNSLVEREVESVYNKGINIYFPNAEITHPFACDGLIDVKTDNGKKLKLIIEYKLNENMKSSVARAKVLVQVIYYLKRFEENGQILPNVCMVGDVNECFILHTNSLLSYLDENVDWSIAPSDAHKHNPDLIMKIANNEGINPFVFNVDENFSFKEVADKIVNLADNVNRYVRVSEHSISNIFNYFIENVVKEKNIKSNELVSIFIGVITDKFNYYVHPESNNTLVTPSKNIAIDGKAFKSFFSHFDREYTPQEKNKFAEISDRLVEDTKRRNTGEFYTPTLFVDYAHNMLAKTFGEDWKEKFVVWDNCCGTKNLTRDYHFKELYCSTLENAELEISSRYNKEAVSFQFDFLNDSLDKLPEGLRYSFEDNKPIIFLINPPYATASNMGKDGSSKEGIGKTMINEQMLANGIGMASRNLYTQFLYRITEIKKKYNLTNVHIALFCKPNYLSSSSNDKFRNYFLNNFKYSNGVLFNASEFADVSDKWGIDFTIWNCGVSENKNDFVHTLISNVDGEIIINGEKNIYNIDGKKRGNDWVRSEVKRIANIDYVGVTSGIVPNKKEHKYIKGVGDGFLGSMRSVANDVYNSTEFVFLSSTIIDTTGVVPIYDDNYLKIVSFFSARKLIADTWINDKDEYLAPNTDNEKYKEFENDSIIYSLFHSASNQSSLRQVEYKGNKWDIKNEFFFMGKDEIKKLANENKNDDCYNDCNSSSERYVYNLLKDMELSADAKAVLDKAKELVVKSFKYRSLFNEEHPEYQINNWDCGWYQIKALVKEYMPNEYKEFNELYKKLADKMRPMVYELGFLK